jgi:energy-coupling factor transporter transmembrane protein EcfT
MHPVVRILCFLSLITALARANFPFILLADGIFLLFALRTPKDIFSFTWRLMHRMRWFWLSIILLYTLMTPGGGQSIMLGALELSLGGFWLGLERCLALVTVLLFFTLLIHTTPPTQLQGALYWLLQPLRRVGLPADRLSIRIALTLQKIQELQARWSTASGPKLTLGSWREIPDRIASLIQEVFSRAESKPTQIDLSLETSAPGYLQWLMLILLVTLIVVARFYSIHYL